MATETVAYELKITGNLESNARAAARAIDNLGSEAKETERDVKGMGDAFDKAGNIGEKVGSLLGGVWGDLADVTLDLGSKVAGLTGALGPLGAAAVATGAAFGILGAATFMVANRAVEASDALDKVGVAMDTPELDKYSASMTSLGVAFDRLWVTVGEGLAGPLAGFLDWTTSAVNALSAVIDKVGVLGLLDGGEVGKALAEWVQSSNPLPYGEYGPSMDWMTVPGAKKATGGLDPGYAGYRMGPDGTITEGPPPNYAAMQNLIGVPVTQPDQWDTPFGLAPSAEKKTPQPGVGLAALGAAASGAGLGGALGALGPWGALAGAIATPDLSGNLTGAFDQAATLIDELPDILNSVLTEFVPHVLDSLPGILADALGLIPNLLVTVIGSLDDIIKAAVQAIIVGLPQALRELVGGGPRGASDAMSYAAQHNATRDTSTRLAQLSNYAFGATTSTNAGGLGGSPY